MELRMPPTKSQIASRGFQFFFHLSAHNFQTCSFTTKLCTIAESCNIQNSKTVHSFWWCKQLNSFQLSKLPLLIISMAKIYIAGSQGPFWFWQIILMVFYWWPGAIIEKKLAKLGWKINFTKFLHCFKTLIEPTNII